MGELSIWHWLIVLLVIALVFGTGKLRNIGSDLGGAVKGFREAMRSDDQTAGQSGPARLMDPGRQIDPARQIEQSGEDHQHAAEQRQKTSGA